MSYLTSHYSAQHLKPHTQPQLHHEHSRADMCAMDQCSSCLWKRYHSCIHDSTQAECEENPEHHWCGPDSSVHDGVRAGMNLSAAPASVPAAPVTTAPASCGSCNGCMLISAGPAVGCYTTWSENLCNTEGPEYQWCGGSTPVNPTTLNCCNSSVTPAVCSQTTNTSCPPGTTQVDLCSHCTSGTACSNPYYGSDQTSSCGLSTLLPNNALGLQRWLQLFPALDPTSRAYNEMQCDATWTNKYRPVWGAGCLMFQQGGNNGLTAFLQAASQFKGFASGPDPRRNLIELAAFFGNVMQETGEPAVKSGLVYSAEQASCMSSLFGKGPIQLTGSINYQMATQGLAKPSDFNQLITMAGPLQGACATNNALQYDNLGDCWTQCASQTPAAPPHGAGYNLCAKPWLASGYDDTVNPPVLNPIPAWSSALWYWMNAPIDTSIATGFYKLNGDVGCATAHNLIQDPQYNCGDWCAVATISQVGCPSCCRGTVDPSLMNTQTVSRIGNIVRMASILGLPEAQGATNMNNLFCSLVNTCASGGGVLGSPVCPSNLSYAKYLTNYQIPLCGNVTHDPVIADPPAPLCKAVPNNAQGATDSTCLDCSYGQQTWPCNIAGACKWVTN